MGRAVQWMSHSFHTAGPGRAFRPVDSPDTSAMPNALDLARGDPRLTRAVHAARKLLHRRSLLAAAASTVPIPGVDWAVDAALLTRLVPEINALFGLAPTQLDAMEARQRERVQKAVTVVGSVLIGKIVTRGMVLRLLTTVGVRMTGKQAAKYVPLAGQAIAAAAGYTALRFLGEQHLQDCVRVSLAAQHLLAPPDPTTTRP